MTQLTGYAHPDYAASLKEFGIPRELPHCQGWVLERQIPDSRYVDAMGCYPLFCCGDWSRLKLDLEEAGRTWVALSLVTEPFVHLPQPGLEDCFPHLVRPFKEHYVADLSRSPDWFITPSHKRNARRAFRELAIEHVANPAQQVDIWSDLYGHLIRRHHIEGLRVFSRSSFERQLRVPGLVSFRALRYDETVGMLLWYVRGDAAFYHLGASSELGYRFCASFALCRFAIDYFRTSGLRWLSFGAGAGVGDPGFDGLARFKKGWSTGTRRTYFCGRIFDKIAYEELGQGIQGTAEGYFPAYRRGEFL